MMTPVFIVSLWDSVQKVVPKVYMCRECAPSVTVYRIIGCGGFIYYFSCVYDDASKNIQEVISMGRGLIWNDATVYGGRMDMKILVRYLSDMWKFFDIDSSIIFVVPYMC